MKAIRKQIVFPTPKIHATDHGSILLSPLAGFTRSFSRPSDCGLSHHLPSEKPLAGDNMGLNLGPSLIMHIIVLSFSPSSQNLLMLQILIMTSILVSQFNEVTIDTRSRVTRQYACTWV